MQRITLFAIGRLKEPWAREACTQYLERMRPQADVRVVELMPSKGRQPAAQQIEESERLISQLKHAEGEIFILDEKGKEASSMEFSHIIGAARDRGTPLIFILGGAYGLTDNVRNAGKTMRLSAMTLPHELARVVFLEQLYRGFEIGKGSGYHH